MSIPSSAAIYGVGSTPAPTTAPVGGVAPAGTAGAAITDDSKTPGGWHQNPVLILVALVGVAFLLARGAEHGLSFGFSTKVRAK